jgi:hypothetical protein
VSSDDRFCRRNRRLVLEALKGGTLERPRACEALSIVVTIDMVVGIV